MGYLIELRAGYPRPLLKNGIEKIVKKYRLTHQKPEVPHLSLYGSFQCKRGISIGRIKNEIEHAAGRYDSLRYYIDGFSCKKGEDGWAIAYNILPSKSLRDFNETLRPRLWELTDVRKSHMLLDPEYEWYHITIAFRLGDSLKYRISKDLGEIHIINPEGQCSKIIDYSCSESSIVPNLFLPIDALRITLIDGHKIHSEYDLVRKQWYTRHQAKSPETLKQTLGAYRKHHGIQLTTPDEYHEPTVFVTSDLHLGHSNIIKYCARPFLYDHVEEMNRVLIQNWNYLVHPSDDVYFLGDLASTRSHSTDHYLSKLNGNIIFLKGNHDDHSVSYEDEQLVLTHDSTNFLLTHDPKEVIPSDFDGWVIHGHKHNSDIKKYPLIDFTNKRINVSQELTNYQPVRLQFLNDLIHMYDENIYFINGNRGLIKESDIFDNEKAPPRISETALYEADVGMQSVFGDENVERLPDEDIEIYEGKTFLSRVLSKIFA